jgi:hypothetical protein
MLDGYVSAETAKRDYGIAVASDAVDWVATKLLRKNKQGAES